MSITVLIIIGTALVSIRAFNDHQLFDKLQFSPYVTVQYKEWYRIVSHALLHGDWMHLIFNMYVLYIFGEGIKLPGVEETFAGIFGGMGTIYYLLLYVGGAAFASIPALRKHENNPGYVAIGASGAVAAVLFASIILFPMNRIHLFFIPFGIPAFIFGPLYIGLEYYLDKRGGGRIAHDAHYWGAMYGIALPLVLEPQLVSRFIDQVF